MSLPTTAHAFAWVVDFPLFEQDPASGAWLFTHHPFTSPHPDDLAVPRIRAVALPRIALRRRVQRQRTRRRSDPHHRSGAAGECVRVPRNSGRGAAARFGFLLDGLAVGRTAARWLRARFRSYRHAAGGRALAAGRDRISEDRRGTRTVRGCTDARVAGGTRAPFISGLQSGARHEQRGCPPHPERRGCRPAPRSPV